MKHIKRIDEYVSYQGIELKNVDIDPDLNLVAELKKIRILYTTFRDFENLELDDIEGYVDPFTVDLKLGSIEIYGEYDNGIEETIAKFKMNDFSTEFRYHKHGPMGGNDLEDFEKEVESTLKELLSNLDEKKYTLCISHEGYVTNNIKTGTKEEIEQALEEYQMYIVKGTQIEGKRLGVTMYNDESEYNPANN